MINYDNNNKSTKQDRTGRKRFNVKTQKFESKTESNLQKVLDLLINTDISQPKYLAKAVGVTGRTVLRYLRILKRQRKVEKIEEKGHKWKYRVTDSYLVSKEAFAHIMKPMVIKMIDLIWLPEVIKSSRTYNSARNIDKKGNERTRNRKGTVIGGRTIDEAADLHDKYSSLVYGLPHQREFYERMSSDDSTISTKYRPKFGQAETAEKFVFEFVNRIAAFITYMFIESIKAINEKPNQGNDIARVIIDKGIDLHGVFREFRYLCSYLKADPNEISRAFHNVYPTGKILDKYWYDRVQTIQTGNGYRQKG